MANVRLISKILIVSAALSFPVFAAKPILIVTEDLPPMQIIDNGKIVDGIAFHKVTQLLDSANLKGRWLVTPWSRAYHMALTRPNILLCSIVRTAEREDKFVWLAPLYTMEIYLISLKQRSIQVDSLEAAKGYFIGVKRSDVLLEYLNREGFSANANLVVLRDTEVTFEALYKDRVDMVPGNKEMIEAFCKTRLCSIDDFVLNVHLKDMPQDFYLVASKGTDANIIKSLIAATNAQLNPAIQAPQNVDE